MSNVTLDIAGRKFTVACAEGEEAHIAMLGQTINGTYELVRLLGAGGMGNVYEAKHTRLPKRFAIKVVRSEMARDEAAFERFKREADIASSLGNRHIAEVHDWNVLPDGSPYMVMELLTGEDSDALAPPGGELLAAA